MTVPKMMPGQMPYTQEEILRLNGLVSDAAAGDPGEDMEEYPDPFPQIVLVPR